MPGEREHEILVRDYGPGLQPGKLELLFDPGARPGSFEQPAGLGLQLTRRVVTAHGGSMRAESPEGGGLRVALRLPAR